MSEIEAPGSDAAVAPAPPAAAESFGRRLAAERERLGLSVDDVASRLRLHPRQVQAIESESLPSLPAPFLRGFVRNYAKELRLDPEPLVAELSARLGPQTEKVARVDTGTTSSSRIVTADLASRRVVIGGTIAALVALAVLGWLATHSERPAEVPQPAATSPVQPASPAPSMNAPTPDGAKETQPPGTGSASSSGSDVPASPSSATGTAGPIPGNAPTGPAAASAAPVAATAVAPQASSGLRMSFREQAWVEVTQSDGRILQSQINPAGSEQRIDAKPPLKLVVGNASAVSIEYKGKVIDLKPATSPDNVARITLN